MASTCWIEVSSTAVSTAYALVVKNIVLAEIYFFCYRIADWWIEVEIIFTLKAFFRVERDQTILNPVITAFTHRVLKIKRRIRTKYARKPSITRKALTWAYFTSKIWKKIVSSNTSPTFGYRRALLTISITKDTVGCIIIKPIIGLTRDQRINCAD